MIRFGTAAFALACITLTSAAFAKTCTDESVEKVGSYNHANSRNVFGSVLRLEFKRDHTLVVLQGYDDEVCAILPPRADLMRRKVNLSWLQPGVSFGIAGSQHKAEDGRVWVVGIRHDSAVDPLQVR